MLGNGSQLSFSFSRDGKRGCIKNLGRAKQLMEKILEKIILFPFQF